MIVRLSILELISYDCMLFKSQSERLYFQLNSRVIEAKLGLLNRVESAQFDVD